MYRKTYKGISPMKRTSFNRNTVFLLAAVATVILGHAWLHKSHAALANPPAAVLRQMKAEGLFELYSRQTGFHPDKRSPKWVNGPKQKP